MADQHNSNIPAIGNTIAADIPDIKENLEFHKDAFQRIFATWSDTDNSAAVFSTTPGFNNGTYAITFPTNGMAAAKLMLGNSNTITWFYLNSAPPGWKTYISVEDAVLGIAGGTAAYNVSGGSPGGNWVLSGLTADAHTHTGPSHDHAYSGTTSEGSAAIAGTSAGADGDGVTHTHTYTGTSAAGGTGGTSAASANGVTSTGAWRPAAVVGKLFQLDTA